MPRDFSTYRPRLRSPPCSMSRTSSHVSMSDETATSVSSCSPPPGVRLAKKAVMPRTLSASTRRSSMRCTSPSPPTFKKLDIGSTTNCGSKAVTSLSITDRCISRPSSVGRAAWIFSSPCARAGARSMPIEPMLRTIWLGDSSKAKYSTRSPRPQAATANDAARLVLPVPAVPATSTLLPRKKPWPPSIASRPTRPLETRSLEAWCCSPTEVMGSTEMPVSSMRNGYSLLPCVEPRYLTTRKRLDEAMSTTRWSSTMTQSETYSSRPSRVSAPAWLPRSPVMMVVRPRSFNQRNRRRNSARKMAGLGRPANSVSSVSSTTCRAPTLRTVWSRRMNRPSRS